MLGTFAVHSCAPLRSVAMPSSFAHPALQSAAQPLPTERCSAGLFAPTGLPAGFPAGHYVGGGAAAFSAVPPGSVAAAASPSDGSYTSDARSAAAIIAAPKTVTNRRVSARQRQVDIGKARPEYIRYAQCVPKDCRTPSRPITPDPQAKVSKRQFDRQLSEWRRRLHEYDDPSLDPPPEDGSAPCSSATDGGSEDEQYTESNSLRDALSLQVPPATALLPSLSQTANVPVGNHQALSSTWINPGMSLPQSDAGGAGAPSTWRSSPLGADLRSAAASVPAAASSTAPLGSVLRGYMSLPGPSELAVRQVSLNGTAASVGSREPAYSSGLTVPPEPRIQDTPMKIRIDPHSAAMLNGSASHPNTGSRGDNVQSPFHSAVNGDPRFQRGGSAPIPDGESADCRVS